MSASVLGQTAPSQSAPLAAAVCDVRSFGAKGDGVALDTVPVSKAIAACVKQGGGTVYFSPGRYVIGTVQLYSHIHLQLQNGAALVGSHDIHDYLPSPPFGFARNYGVDITGEGTVLGMLIAKNAEDVSIDGGGEIDGQSDSFMGMKISHGGNDYDQNYTRQPGEVSGSNDDGGLWTRRTFQPTGNAGRLLSLRECKDSWHYTAFRPKLDPPSTGRRGRCDLRPADIE